jgi:hypothetical protein
MRFPFVCLAARHSSRGDGPGASTPGYVKLLLPPRQSRGNSHFGLAPSPFLLAPRLRSFPACGAGDLVRVEGHVLALGHKVTDGRFNVKIAKTLGVSFPLSLLGRADEVIE